MPLDPAVKKTIMDGATGYAHAVGTPEYAAWLLSETELALGVGVSSSTVARLISMPGAGVDVWRRVARAGGSIHIRGPLAKHPVARQDPEVRRALERSTAFEVQRELFHDDMPERFYRRWSKLLDRGLVREAMTIVEGHAAHPGMALITEDDWAQVQKMSRPGTLYLYQVGQTVPAWRAIITRDLPGVFAMVARAEPPVAQSWIRSLTPALTGRLSRADLAPLLDHPQTVFRAESLLAILNAGLQTVEGLDREALVIDLKSTLEGALATAPARLERWITSGGTAQVNDMARYMTETELGSLMARLASIAIRHSIAREEKRAAWEQANQSKLSPYQMSNRGPIPANYDFDFHMRMLPKVFAPYLSAEVMTNFLSSPNQESRVEALMATATMPVVNTAPIAPRPKPRKRAR